MRLQYLDEQYHTHFILKTSYPIIAQSKSCILGSSNNTRWTGMSWMRALLRTSVVTGLDVKPPDVYVSTSDRVDISFSGVIKSCDDASSALDGLFWGYILGTSSGTSGPCDCVYSKLEVSWAVGVLIPCILAAGSAISTTPSDAVSELKRVINGITTFTLKKWHYPTSFLVLSMTSLLLPVSWFFLCEGGGNI